MSRFPFNLLHTKWLLHFFLGSLLFAVATPFSLLHSQAARADEIIPPQVDGVSAQVRGGSDIINYNFDWPNGVGNAPCLRDAYGFIKSLDKNPTMVQSVLQTMYNNGQRRLGIELLWSRDPANAQSGLVMYGF